MKSQQFRCGCFRDSRFQIAGKALMKAGARRVGNTFIGDVAGYYLPEHELSRAAVVGQQQLQLLERLCLGGHPLSPAQHRVIAGEPVQTEVPSDDAGGLQRRLLVFVQAVQPAENQAVETGGQTLVRTVRCTVCRHVVRQLLQVIGVAVSLLQQLPGHRLRDFRRVTAGCQLPGNQASCFGRQQRCQGNAGVCGAGMLLAAARADQQHRQAVNRTADLLQQITRERVEPVDVLQHKHQHTHAAGGTLTCVAEQFNQECLAGALALLPIQCGSQRCIADAHFQYGAKQRKARQQLRRQFPQCRFNRTGVLCAVQSQNRTENPPPRVVGGVGPEGFPFATQDAAACRGRTFQQFLEQTCLAQPGLTGNADDAAASAAGTAEFREQPGQLSGPAKQWRF